MSKYLGWTPPPGVAVVAPPVHPKTVVDVILDDGDIVEGWLAGSQNWSAVGDGPSIVAYAVVSEYKPAPEPREWWIDPNQCLCTAFFHHGFIHVREVLPEAREAVAWAVVDDRDGGTTYWDSKEAAASFAKGWGGTVVKLTGVMPNG